MNAAPADVQAAPMATAGLWPGLPWLAARPGLPGACARVPVPVYPRASGEQGRGDRAAARRAGYAWRMVAAPTGAQALKAAVDQLLAELKRLERTDPAAADRWRRELAAGLCTIARQIPAGIDGAGDGPGADAETDAPGDGRGDGGSDGAGDGRGDAVAVTLPLPQGRGRHARLGGGLA